MNKTIIRLFLLICLTNGPLVFANKQCNLVVSEGNQSVISSLRKFNILRIIKEKKQSIISRMTRQNQAGTLAKVQTSLLHDVINSELLVHRKNIDERLQDKSSPEIGTNSFVIGDKTKNTITELSRLLGKLQKDSEFMETVIQNYEMRLFDLKTETGEFSKYYRSAGGKAENYEADYKAFKIHLENSNLDTSLFYLTIKKLTEINLKTQISSLKDVNDKGKISAMLKGHQRVSLGSLCVIGVCSLVLNSMEPGMVTMGKLATIFGAIWSPIILHDYVAPGLYMAYNKTIRPLQSLAGKQSLKIALKKQFLESTENSIEHTELIDQLFSDKNYRQHQDVPQVLQEIKNLGKVNVKGLDFLKKLSSINTQLLLTMMFRTLEPLSKPDLNLVEWRNRWSELNSQGLPTKLQARDIEILKEAKVALSRRLSVSKEINDSVAEILSVLNNSEGEIEPGMVTDYRIFRHILFLDTKNISDHALIIGKLVASIDALIGASKAIDNIGSSSPMMIEFKSNHEQYITSEEIMASALLNSVDVKVEVSN